MKFIDGFTLLVHELHLKEQASVFAQGEEEVFGRALQLVNLLDGAVRADVLEEVALDEASAHRVMAAVWLANRRFISGAPVEFWEKLEGQLPQSPELFNPVMSHYLAQRSPVKALKCLKLLPNTPTNTTALNFHLAEALREIRRYSNWDNVIKKSMSELPRWCLDYLREHEHIKSFGEALEHVQN